jgi:hypothetical protein
VTQCPSTRLSQFTVGSSFSSSPLRVAASRGALPVAPLRPRVILGTLQQLMLMMMMIPLTMKKVDPHLRLTDTA